MPFTAKHSVVSALCSAFVRLPEVRMDPCAKRKGIATGLIAGVFAARLMLDIVLLSADFHTSPSSLLCTATDVALQNRFSDWEK